jgi:hypothetical protein
MSARLGAFRQDVEANLVLCRVLIQTGRFAEAEELTAIAF